MEFSGDITGKDNYFVGTVSYYSSSIMWESGTIAGVTLHLECEDSDSSVSNLDKMWEMKCNVMLVYLLIKRMVMSPVVAE